MPESKQISTLGHAVSMAGGTVITAALVPIVDVRKLLDGQREAMLVLDGEPYRLRITAKDKLILTK